MYIYMHGPTKGGYASLCHPPYMYLIMMHDSEIFILNQTKKNPIKETSAVEKQ